MPGTHQFTRAGLYRIDYHCTDGRWREYRTAGYLETLVNAYDVADNFTDHWRIVKLGETKADDRVLALGPAFAPREVS
jgi:hypothetical protein